MQLPEPGFKRLELSETRRSVACTANLSLPARPRKGRVLWTSAPLRLHFS